MKTKTVHTIITAVMILSMLIPMTAMPAAAAPIEPPAMLSLLEEGPPDQGMALFEDGFINVRVVAPEGTDLSKYGQFVARRIPEVYSGMTVYYGRVAETTLPTLKADRRVVDVARVQELAEAPETRPDPDVTTRELPSLEETKARLTALRNNPPEPTQRPEPSGWWDVSAGGHNAAEAWEAGYEGQGVKVAVNDSGVDMAHPDFWGTEARYENVSGDPYYDYFDGWPMALSPFANYLMAFDLEFNGQLTNLNTFAFGASVFADTSTTGTGGTIVFASQTYTTTGTASPANPVYHIGYHPDWSLYAYIWGERIAVLVADEDGDDVYDTVYVDLNNNKDFRDDKPVRKDTNPADNYAQGADELSWWDADLDGYPDVSGGMLFFIADGDHCPPFFDVYFGCAGNGTGSFDPPDNGDLLAFMFVNLYDTDHGQLCASNVVGQGNINGDAPDVKPDGMGGMVQGPGRAAQLVPVGDIYYAFEQSVEQTWWFQALGYDGIVTGAETPGSDDGLQASSNSFGPWQVYEDGWDEWSRVPTFINHFVNPYTTYFMSSGNTGGGYGTTGAPQPITAVQVGSSSQYGSTDTFELLASLEQITVGETASYSSRGPSANNQLVPHVTANGAWASGALGLNEWGDGWTAWDTWGGTSRSGPLAMGASTLVMDAYEGATGQWPDWFTVRQILMQGANHIYNDPMTGGTGYVNAGRSAGIAAGDYGVVVSPDYWDAGDFDGSRYDGGFAHIAEPGGVYTTNVAIDNMDGATAATVTVSDYILEEIGVYTHTFTTLNYTLEDGEFLKPDYLFDVEDIVGGSLPADTVFMLAELMHPFDTYDFGADDVVDNYFRLNSYDWTDLNGDGNLWEDVNGNGLVEWGEIDELEYVRINRAYDDAHFQIMPISDPLHRFHDGVFLSIRHRQMSADVPTTPLTLRVILYRQADWGALDTSAFGGSFAIPAGGSVTEVVTFTAPAEYGFYQGAIQFDVEPASGEDYTTIVPVFAQVAYSGDLTAEPVAVRFGDTDDADQLYSNGFVRPIQDWWQGRATGGDWRFFFLNQDTNPNASGRQTKMVARTWWDADAPPADIDTYLLGPDYHFSSISNDPGPVFGSSYAVPDAFWGPYSMRITGMSESPLLSDGHWAFDTATGANVDYAVGDFNQGLNGLQIHSHRYDGTDFREDFAVAVGFVDAPEFLEWDNYATERITLTTNLTFTEGITVTAFGLAPVDIADEPNQFVPGPSTGAFNACVATYFYTFTVATDLKQLHVWMGNFGGDDLDLFLLYDANDDGVMDCASEVVANSGNAAGTPEEIFYGDPLQGTYWVAVDPYTVGDPAGAYFDLLIDGMEMGDPIQVANLDVDAFDPSNTVSFDVLNKAGTCDDATQTCLGGWVRVSLDTTPPVNLFEIPVSPRYNRVDLSQLSDKEVSATTALPGDVLTYTIHVVSTAGDSGTVVVTDVLPSGVTMLDATPGYTEVTSGTLVWDSVSVASGGGQIVTADYDWVDVSGEPEYTGTWISYYPSLDPYDDDEGVFAVTLPFTYTFFGTDYTVAYVSGNGQLQFDPRLNTKYGDGYIPGTDFLATLFGIGPMDNRIAVLFGDQRGPNANDTGIGNPRVFTYHDDSDTPGDTSDDRFIVQWDEWQLTWRPCYSLLGIGCDLPYPDNTYQLILYPDGRAEAQYAEINQIPPGEFVSYVGGVYDFWNPTPDAGVEAPGDEEGYKWHLTPASGLAWEYIPTSTSDTVITITAQVNAGLSDTILCNEATLDNGYGQVTDVEACTTVGQAKLDVVKLVDPWDVAYGDVVTFTVEIDNNGPFSTTVTLTDTLDAGLAFGSFIAPTTGFYNVGQVITGSVFITESETFELVYTASIVSTEYNDFLCNDVLVDNGFGLVYDDYDCLFVNYLDLSSSDKTVAWDDPHPWPGTVVTYTIEVVNDSLVTTTAWITDVLPTEVTFGGIVTPTDAGYASGVITASFAAVGPGVTEHVVFTATINTGLLRSTTVDNETEIEDAAGAVWTVDVDFDVENADFSTSYKDGPSNAVPGDNFFYNIYVINSGTLTTTATVTDIIPPEVEVITAWLPPELSYNPASRTVSWSGVVSVSSGMVVEIPVEVQRVPSTVVINEAYITGGDDVYVTDPLYTNIHSAELYLEKGIVDSTDWDYIAHARWGEVVTYTLSVSNTGTISTSVSLMDPMPDGVVVVTGSLPSGVTYDSVLHSVSWSGDLAAHDGIELHIPVYGALAAADGDKALFNQFHVTDEWNQVYESNAASLEVQSAEIEVLKFADYPTVKPGETITYTVILRNTGDYGTRWGITPWEATMVDNLPTKVTYIPGSLQVVVDPGLGGVSCTPVGGNIVCTFNVDPDWDSNEVAFRYAVTVDLGVSMGTLLTNTVSINDSYGVMSYGQNVVEVLAAYQIYLPLVTKD